MSEIKFPLGSKAAQTLDTKIDDGNLSTGALRSTGQKIALSDGGQDLGVMDEFVFLTDDPAFPQMQATLRALYWNGQGAFFARFDESPVGTYFTQQVIPQVEQSGAAHEGQLDEGIPPEPGFTLTDGLVGLSLLVSSAYFALQLYRSTKFGAKDQVEQDAAVEAAKKAQAKTRNYLQEYGEDLVEKFRTVAEDPAIARDPLIKKVTRTLTMPPGEKGSVMLVGDPGVGKSVIVESIGWKISHGQIPELVGYKLITIKLGDIQAAGSGISDIPSVVKGIIDQAIAEYGRVIIHIPEIHRLSGVGTHSTNKLDISEEFKDPMARGALRIIGDTTPIELEENLAKNKALMRRFERVDAEVLTGNDLFMVFQRRALKICREVGAVRKMTINIDEASMREIIRVSGHYYIGQQPDAAISMLTEILSSDASITRVDNRVITRFLENRTISRLQAKLESLKGEIQKSVIELRESEGVEVVFDDDTKLDRLSGEALGQAIQRLKVIKSRLEALSQLAKSGQAALPHKIQISTEVKVIDLSAEDKTPPSDDPPAAGGAVAGADARPAPKALPKARGTSHYQIVAPFTPSRNPYTTEGGKIAGDVVGPILDGISQGWNQLGAALAMSRMQPIVAGGGRGAPSNLMFRGMSDPLSPTAPNGAPTHSVGGRGNFRAPVPSMGTGAAQLAGELGTNAVIGVGMGLAMEEAGVPTELHLPVGMTGLYVGNAALYRAGVVSAAPSVATMGIPELPGMTALSAVSAVALDRAAQAADVDTLKAGNLGNTVGSLTLGVAPYAAARALPSAAALGSTPAFAAASKVLGAAGVTMLGEALGNGVIYSWFKVKGVISGDSTAVADQRLSALAWSMVNQENGIEKLPILGSLVRGMEVIAGQFSKESEAALSKEVGEKKILLTKTATEMVQQLTADAMTYAAGDSQRFKSFIAGHLTSEDRKKDGLTDLIFLVAEAEGERSTLLQNFTEAFDKEGEVQSESAIRDLMATVVDRQLKIELDSLALSMKPEQLLKIATSLSLRVDTPKTMDDLKRLRSKVGLAMAQQIGLAQAGSVRTSTDFRWSESTAAQLKMWGIGEDQQVSLQRLSGMLQTVYGEVETEAIKTSAAQTVLSTQQPALSLEQVSGRRSQAADRTSRVSSHRSQTATVTQRNVHVLAARRKVRRGEVVARMH